jgi:tetratricopeptide (TPR) repeat protein
MSGRPWWLVGAIGLLGGCASVAPGPSSEAASAPAAPTKPPAAAAPRESVGTGLQRFEAEQRAAAAVAAGRWRQAAWHWEAVAVLRPEDPQPRREVERALAQAEQAAQAKLPAARRARQRGDAEAASRLYLEVLALAPAQAEAKEALRAIERERVARLHLGQLSSFTLTNRSTAGAMMQAESSRAPRGRAPLSNEIEHASLLAEQGELDAAIELLLALVTADKPNPAARSLLADLYVRRAKALAETDRPGAIRALERSLRMQPAQAEARRLLQLWQPDAKAPTRQASPR